MIRKERNKRPSFLNGISSLFIVICSGFFFWVGCGSSEEPAPASGTGSEEQGMHEEQGEKEELLGRIETLQKKYEELGEAPSRLGDSSKAHWERSIEQADSLLRSLNSELQGEETSSPEQQKKAEIDRTLQRLAIQARSMEKAKKGNPQEEHP